jgi:hypothetical protein
VADDPRPSGPLAGTWIKVDAPVCAERYPDRVTFSTGTYRGERGPAQGMVWWDAGIYRLEDPQTLVLSVATDELVRYAIRLHGGDLLVTDPEGCEFRYRRQPPAGPRPGDPGPG